MWHLDTIDGTKIDHYLKVSKCGAYSPHGPILECLPEHSFSSSPHLTTSRVSVLHITVRSPCLPTPMCNLKEAKEELRLIQEAMLPRKHVRTTLVKDEAHWPKESQGDTAADERSGEAK